ncbi:ABC transporter permease [Enterovirga sp. CN4-39]|uniref:ABC transporter permease n=1 Tax=Enterovirga sp. CN4-39 TaxID=3400910 RepID=UPI003C0E6453
MASIAQTMPGQAPGGFAWPAWTLKLGRNGLLIVPAVAFMAAFYFAPLANLFAGSVLDQAGSLTLGHYASALSSRRVLTALERTMRLSVATTAITFLIAYPIALFLIGCGRRLRTAILVVTFASLAASLIVRNYGWLIVLADAGPVNQLMLALGIFEAPVRMAYSEGAVLVGLVHYALPFMILPIYGSLVRLSPSTWEAAQSLGASPVTALRTVVLPLSMSGIYGGVSLTFAIATSAFVTPLMLGAPSTAFVSQVAADEMLVQLNFARGAAIVVVLTVCTFAALAAYTFSVRRIGVARV